MRTALALLTLIPLAACELNRTKDSGVAESWACEEAPTVVAPSDITALGFSGADVLAVADAARSSSFVYSADAHSTLLSLDATYTDGEIRYIQSDEPVGETGMSYAGEGDADVAEPYPESDPCPDRVEVDVSLSFATEDGVFAEVFELALRASQLDQVSFAQDLDLSAMGGSFNIDDYSTAVDYDERNVGVSGSFGPDGATSGQVSGQASGSEECPEDEPCTAWAEIIEVGTWGATVVE